VGHQEAEARALLGLAALACEAEGDHGQALELLDRAQDLGGDEQFWYQLTLTRVRATAGLGGDPQEAGTKVGDNTLYTLHSARLLQVRHNQSKNN